MNSCLPEAAAEVSASVGTSLVVTRSTIDSQFVLTASTDEAAALAVAVEDAIGDGGLREARRVGEREPDEAVQSVVEPDEVKRVITGTESPPITVVPEMDLLGDEPGCTSDVVVGATGRLANVKMLVGRAARVAGVKWLQLVYSECGLVGEAADSKLGDKVAAIGRPSVMRNGKRILVATDDAANGLDVFEELRL